VEEEPTRCVTEPSIFRHAEKLFTKDDGGQKNAYKAEQNVKLVKMKAEIDASMKASKQK